MTDRVKTLIIGAGGQIGTELTETLRSRYNPLDIIATDIKPNERLASTGPFRILDVMDREKLFELIKEEKIEHVYNLAALLSATGEKRPDFAWKLNMEGHLNVLDAARDHGVKRIFWPSSIAVFGPTTPRDHTPQDTIMDPNTVYGISKLAGERWSAYYHERWGVDVRSLRYPGLIGWKSQPGGGTTDYAVEIFHKALSEGSYTSFLGPDSRLPMMYMDDAIRCTLELMQAPESQIKVRSSYNIAGMDFTPAEIAAAIQKHLPTFEIKYEPDSRQAIADSWPSSIDDTSAREDWGWKMKYDLEAMTADMLENIGAQLERK